MPKNLFKAGQSGNPGGRPKDSVRVREIAREKSEEALNVLLTLMQTAAKDRDRIAAACAVLDRGLGKPHQSISAELQGELKNAGFQLIIQPRELPSAKPTIEVKSDVKTLAETV